MSSIPMSPWNYHTALPKFYINLHNYTNLKVFTRYTSTPLSPTSIHSSPLEPLPPHALHPTRLSPTTSFTPHSPQIKKTPEIPNPLPFKPTSVAPNNILTMTKFHTEIDLGLPSDTTPASELMHEFDRLSSQIEHDIHTASESLAHLYTLFSSNASPSKITPPFQHLENLVTIIRTQLAALAERNNAAKKSPNIGPASIKIRVNRFGKLARDFSDFLAKFEEIRERFRHLLHDGIRRQVIHLQPKLTDADVDDIMRHERKMDLVLETSSPEQIYQVEDLKARNRQLANLNRHVAQLHEMFVELSFLTEAQQSLINEVELNIKDTKEDVEKADDELIVARKIQNKIRKKQLLIAAIFVIILAAIIVIIILQVG